MLSLRASSSSSSSSSRRRRSAAISSISLSPAAALLLLHRASASASNTTNTTIIESPTQYRLFPVKFVSNPPNGRLGECEGDCDNNGQCAEGLTCFQRDRNEDVPGCSGGASDNSLTDYCIRPVPAANDAGPTTTEAPTAASSALVTPTPQPTVTNIQSPTPPSLNATAAPTSLPTPDPTAAEPTLHLQKTITFVANPPKAPLNECEGDCDDDTQCAAGLKCHQRDPFEAVPGCSGGESSGRYTDYCINDSTPSPTTSYSPTPLPTISTMPSMSAVPSTQPSLNPTPAPNSISEKFKLRLYWHRSYYWQETRRETFWCWQCRNGCKKDNKIEIDHCKNADYFQFHGEDNSYRPVKNPNLCVTEDGFDSESRPLRLRQCDGGIKQKWVNSGDVGLNFDPDRPWEIYPESDLGKCVTQMHHPKAHERVFLRRCKYPRKNTTSKWVVY